MCGNTWVMHCLHDSQNSWVLNSRILACVRTSSHKATREYLQTNSQVLAIKVVSTWYHSGREQFLWECHTIVLTSSGASAGWLLEEYLDYMLVVQGDALTCFETDVKRYFCYRKSGFDYESLLIANRVFFHTSQSKESQKKEYAMNHITRDLTPFAQTLNMCSHLHSTVQLRSAADCWDGYSSIVQVNIKPANTHRSATVTKTSLWRSNKQWYQH